MDVREAMDLSLDMLPEIDYGSTQKTHKAGTRYVMAKLPSMPDPGPRLYHVDVQALPRGESVPGQSLLF